MSIKEKYSSLLDFGKELGMKNVSVEEKEDALYVNGVVNTAYEKNIYWDKLKSIGGEKPSDIKADIRILDESVYAYHTVQKGESLSKIAKYYYKDASKYNAIFKANIDILKDPNLIHPGQVLKIPKL
ncbi:LysM peptidoglycan-binding domain-containing protein [Capnocytophaga canimorsus]|uniref:Peptidoglycan-binding protein n=1 Tax=Capnocytophaga canimorsus TaxID=28188 RepID=A0AAD0E988_9FLAO|nr:LysM peptidoglycan-binding domain-containing protein [Capnocytophaga canimorsus]ATA92992.1 peptidoglycan-binding protein [Capnocytophaga canimorsus]AYW36203.1 LysM peptidoglycan-binding domain-containing protein [Capnocytophaga canimorsus]GIM58333.1 peptidoglycan-binding protein LysM [Capnocytophaga canimorsus]